MERKVNVASLRQLIEAGQYELAAHRLVYGVVRARVNETIALKAGAGRVKRLSGRTEGPVRREISRRG